MTLPHGITGSLCPDFSPVRPVGLAVKRPYTITLCARLPSVLRAPWEASVTLLEATTPVKLPTKRCPPSLGLGLEYTKGSISTATPRILAYPNQCLLPILHIMHPNPALSCSKGSHTIRAGRNLPDKEFRYLRTVIVTAAVYWGFDSMRLAYAMTSPLNLPAPGRCQAIYVVFRISIALCFC